MLREVLVSTGQDQLAQDVSSNIELIKQIEEPLRKHRNKKIAHTDYNVAMQFEKLPTFDISTVKDTLKQLSSLLNNISGTLNKSETVFHGLEGEGDLILHYLQKAEKQNAAERATLLSEMSKNGNAQ